MNPNIMKVKQIVVIGCGGIGSQLLTTLTRYIASIDKEERPVLVLVDGDKFEHSNANRQEFPMKLAGENKAFAMKVLYDTKYDGLIEIEAVQGYIGKDNVAEIIKEDSIILSCVDNHVCRRIVSARCQELKNITLISGGNSSKLDGNVQIFNRRDGKSLNPTIEERHPEIATTEDGDRSEMSCEELAEIPGGTQVIFANAFAANLMNVILFDLMNGDAGIKGCDEIYFDGFYAKTKRIMNGIPE